MLGTVDSTDQIVVADFEAGIGTLTRMGGERVVDVILVVVEPSQKSIEVGTRAAALARAEDLGHVVVVANRVEDRGAADAIRAAFPDHEVVVVPEDPAVVAAERDGAALVDVAPDSPAGEALAALAARLAPA